MNTEREPLRIAGPVAQPKKPRVIPPPGAWDSHAHIRPGRKFPYAAGRGYTPPERWSKNISRLDRLGFAHGVVVQGNAQASTTGWCSMRHALSATAARHRHHRARLNRRRCANGIGSACADYASTLLPEDPGYVRGVGLDVFEVFRKSMAELGWVMQLIAISG